MNCFKKFEHGRITWAKMLYDTKLNLKPATEDKKYNTNSRCITKAYKNEKESYNNLLTIWFTYWSNFTLFSRNKFWRQRCRCSAHFGETNCSVDIVNQEKKKKMKSPIKT